MTFDLNGQWKLADDEDEYTLPITLPGDVHTALFEAGVIPDPYWGINDLDLRWIENRDWLMKRTIVLPDDFTTPVYFRGEMVDTIVDVMINGRMAVHNDNMFLPILADVTESVHPGENEIIVHLHSIVDEMVRRNGALTYPVPFNRYPGQQDHRNLLRKVQSHFGWDCAPRLLVAGSYGALELVSIDTPVITALRGYPVKETDRWRIPVTLEAITGSKTLPFRILLIDRNDSIVAEIRDEITAGTAERISVTRTLHVSNPDLWWPNRYGRQPLYTVEVYLGETSQQYRVGFRTVELVRRDDGKDQPVSMRVNERDIWVKGATWVPSDALPARQTDERYEELLHSAACAHMNVIHLWGGGRYERDRFYDLCDEMGLLVWQDFMYADALYPSQEWFLNTARLEAAAQTTRLINHPSIALWCGNSAGPVVLEEFSGTRDARERLLLDFDHLFNGTIGETVRSIDPDRPYLPSSPPSLQTTPSVFYEETPRLCSGFGVPSFPSLHTVRRFTPPDQFNPSAPVIEHHQRFDHGTAVMCEALARSYRLPFDFDSFIYLSQVRQAALIRDVVEYRRSWRPVSMGAVYRQLNDTWPGISRSSLEHNGRWKILHHAARRFFSPVHVAIYVKEEHLYVTAINDTPHAVTGDLELRFLDWHGNCEEMNRKTITVEGDDVHEVFVTSLAEKPFGLTDAFAAVSWDVAETALPVGTRDEFCTTICNWTFLTEPKRCPLREPEILIRMEGDVASGYEAIVEAKAAPAFWVALESENPETRISDSGFLLLPGVARRVPLQSANPEPPRITARHLRSSYR